VPSAKEKNSLKQLVESNFGKIFLACEFSILASWLGQLTGAEMLATGIVNEELLRLSESSAVVHKSFVLESAPGDGFPLRTVVVARADMLPFRDNSIDLLLALHTLQQTRDPRRMVREIERVLKPEGRVILSGLNPFSLSGLWSLGSRGRILGHYAVRETVPRHKLCDWLLLLGLEIEKSHSFAYRPPLNSEALLGKLEFLEKAGGRVWPFFGSGYLVQAQKHVSNLIPLAPARNWRMRLTPDNVATTFNRTCEK
jgi:SAM-dependent methyltransferase